MPERHGGRRYPRTAVRVAHRAGSSINDARFARCTRRTRRMANGKPTGATLRARAPAARRWVRSWATERVGRARRWNPQGSWSDGRARATRGCGS
jgi:hypothetical protein